MAVYLGGQDLNRVHDPARMPRKSLLKMTGKTRSAYGLVQCLAGVLTHRKVRPTGRRVMRLVTSVAAALLVAQAAAAETITFSEYQPPGDNVGRPAPIGRLQRLRTHNNGHILGQRRPRPVWVRASFHFPNFCRTRRAHHIRANRRYSGAAILDYLQRLEFFRGVL